MTGITRPYDQHYYGGTASSDAGAGTNYDVVLGGRPYMIDWQPVDQSMAFSFHTMPLLQRYFLTQETGNIGEQTLNPEDYWRRSADDWHFGQGQKYNDRANSERGQYRLSTGLDPWTIGQISLLPATTQVLTSVNNIRMVNVGGGFFYVTDGDTLEYATALVGIFTTVTHDGSDTALSGVTSMATDGFTVLVADGTRVHYTTAGDTNFHKYHTVDQVVDLVRMAKGRVFTATDNVLSYSTGANGSAVSNVLLTQTDTNWTWVDVAPGPSAIYFAGFSNDKSLIYSTQVVSDGTNLNVPAVAAELPDGEIVNSITVYLGVMVIGTTKGTRMATTDASGNLSLGSLIPTPNTVRCFEPQDRFVWFGGASGGLNRMDLSVFPNNGTAPAYAGDLQGGVGNASAVITFDGFRVWSIDGEGIFCQDTAGNLVASGTLFQGWWNYSLPDPKQAVKFSIQYQGNGGQITVSSAADFSTTYNQAGAVISSGDQAQSSILTANNTEGVLHETQLVLTRDPVDTTQGPVVTRYTLLSNPQPNRRVYIQLPLMLHSRVDSYAGAAVTYDTAAERAQISVWNQTNQIISYQDAHNTYSVTIDDYDWLVYAQVGARKSLDGTMSLKLKIVN